MERDLPQEVAHMILKVKVSHSLHSTIWRPRKSGAVLPVQTPRLENQEKQRGKCWSESKGPRVRNTVVPKQER
jgi:hypothetical protein